MSSRRNKPPSASGYIALDVDTRPAPVLTGTRAPVERTEAPQPQPFSTMFGGTEYQKMVSMNEVDELEL